MSSIWAIQQETIADKGAKKTKTGYAYDYKKQL